MSDTGDCAPADDACLRRLAANESAFRQVNEAIERGRSAEDGNVGFVCECGRLGCAVTVRLPLPAYEHVRTDFTRFLVVPGHESTVDTVVETHADHLVVVKSGVAAQVAEDLDPRTSEPADDQGQA